MRSLILVLGLGVFTGSAAARTIYDYDGDGRTDLIVKRFNGPNTSFTWFVLQSRDGFSATTWGYQSGAGAPFYDGEAMGDYDGDGKWDITVTRAGLGMPNMFWYVLNSSDGSMTAQHWGRVGDYVLPQDYDGDRKTDFAVRRGSWWYILRSSNGTFRAEMFGTANDDAFPGGDYDGDGSDDLAVVKFRDTNTLKYLVIRYSGRRQWAQYLLGTAFSVGIVSGDFDGDGKADVTGWYGATWRWVRSSDGQMGQGTMPGDATPDTPVPGDYDGDGTTDLAVFRPHGYAAGPNNYFLVQQSRDGFKAVPWGLSGFDSNMFDHRFHRSDGARPANVGRGQPTDEGPLPRLVATGTY
jgi:hypothetical protein